jgi:hypothetical protein
MFSYILPNSENNIFIYTANQPQDGSAQVWSKPANVSMASILLIGAGGSGGLGNTTGSGGTSRTGGGGGASGTTLHAVLPVKFLPDTLYIDVGIGSSGATANGGNTTIFFNTYAANVTLFSAPGGAPGVNGSSIGSAGGINTIAPVANYLTPFVVYTLNGVNGITSANTFPSTAPPESNGAGILSGSVLCAGPAGGGTNATSFSNTGGSANGYIQGTLYTQVSNTSYSDPGFFNWKPFFSVAGAGAGGTGVGNKSGFGSGGGGGAGAFGTGVSGAGGDGLVIISCW